MTTTFVDKRTKMFNVVINPSGPSCIDIRDPDAVGRESDSVPSVAGVPVYEEAVMDSAGRWVWPHKCFDCGVVLALDIRCPPKSCPECGASGGGSSGRADPWVGVGDT